MNQIRDFIATHPAFIALASYLFAGVMVAIFHSRSDAEYASKPPRVAAFWKLLASVTCDSPKAWTALVDVINSDTARARASALASLVAAFTIDPPKAKEAIYQLLTGTRREDDPPPPSPPSASLALTVTVVISIGVASCAERPACSPGQLALIESAYVAEALSTCRGRKASECSELPAIKAKYRAKSEEWVSCR